jgi:DNA replication protein DnaC
LEKCQEFETFGDPQLELMKAAAESFLDDMRYGESPRWVSFLGSSGAGKTMLAKWIISIFKRDLDWKINWPATERTKTESQPYGRIIRYRGGYQTWAGIARSMRDGDYRVLDDLCELTFLVIDDIGAEYGTDFINAKLYELLSRRERKWTVITGNLSLSDIEQRIDARIASRMIRHGSVVVDVNVPDFNLRQAKGTA